MDPVLRAVLDASLALLFASACAHKLRDWPRFRGVVADYDAVPRALAGFVAQAIPASEALAAIAFAAGHAAAPFVGVALLAAYSGAIGINLARGRRDIDCGCGGPQGHRIGPRLLLRNALLGAAALLAGVPASGREMGTVDLATASAAVLFIALAWCAAGRLAALATSPANERALS